MIRPLLYTLLLIAFGTSAEAQNVPTYGQLSGPGTFIGISVDNLGNFSATNSSAPSGTTQVPILTQIPGTGGPALVFSGGPNSFSWDITTPNPVNSVPVFGFATGATSSININTGTNIITAGTFTSSLNAIAPSGFPYPTFPFTTINRWRAASDFTTDVAYTVTDAVAGSNSCGTTTVPQIQLLSGNNGLIRPAALTTTAGVNVNNGQIRIQYRPISNVTTSTSTFQVQLFSSTSLTSPGSNYHFFNAAGLFKGQSTGAGVNSGRCETIGIPLSGFSINGTGADLTSIRFARILTFGSSSFEIGDIDFVPNPRSKGALIVRMDDGDPSAATVMQPMLSAVNAVGMLMPGAISNTIGVSTNLSIAQYQGLLALGWQSASQCYSTENNIIVDGWTRVQRLIEYSNTRNYVRPYNHFNDTVDGSFYSSVGFTDMIAWPELRDSFRTLTNFVNGSASGSPLPAGEVFPFGDPKNIIALNLNSWGNVSDIYASHLLAALDQVRASKGVLVIAMHNEMNSANYVAAMQSMIDYVVNQHPDEMEITTIRRILAPFNNDNLQN